MATLLEFPALVRPPAPTPRAWFRHRSDRPLKVLIVDDEPAICRLVDAILQGTGCATRATSSAEEALDLARQGDFDLLLADFRMPNMTGAVLAANARHYLPNLKVLYLTGVAAGLFEGRITLGVDEAYLAKPCTPAGLIEAISLLVYGHLPLPASHASK